MLLLLPKLKLLTTAGTMLVSVAAYSLIWGWTFAVGFVLLLLVHEMGHVIQLRREGIKASAPMFIPFLGAVVARAIARRQRARRGARRPRRAGARHARRRCAARRSGIATGNDFWRALAFTGFFLNLFNLLPVVPLDGGRAMAAMAPWMWFVGFAALVALAIVVPQPDHPPHPAVRRRWRPGGAGSSASRRPRRSEAYYRVRPATAPLVGRGLRRPDRRCSAVGMDLHAPRTARSADAQAAPSYRARSQLRARISRWHARARWIVSRLSSTSLPRASAISTFACGPLK